MKLASADAFDSVNLAINSLAFETRKYGHFPVFSSRVERAFAEFIAVGGERTTNRFGLRYINSLPPLPSGSKAGGVLHPALKLQIAGWDAPPASPMFPPALVFTGDIEGVGLRISILPTERDLSQPVQAGLVLDLDCFAGAGKLSGFKEFLDKAHGVIRRTFFSLVTDEYLKYLKGA